MAGDRIFQVSLLQDLLEHGPAQYQVATAVYRYGPGYHVPHLFKTVVPFTPSSTAKGVSGKYLFMHLNRLKSNFGEKIFFYLNCK